MADRKGGGLVTPLQRTRLHEEIVEQLKDKIIAGEALPGAKLPTERELAESLGVNRSTVREAINKLESLELVEVKHGSGVFVLDYLESGSLELLKKLLVKDGVPRPDILKNLAELRKMILPEMADCAARNRTADDLRALQQAAFPGDETTISERDRRVHNIIARASGNLIFVVLLNSFTKLLKDYAFVYFDNERNARKSEVFHGEIFEAIKSKDSAGARRIMLEVLDYSEKATFRAIAEKGSRGRSQ